MNFLAHLHLAGPDPAFQVANFLGDFGKGRIERFPEPLQAGMRYHRLVDHLVDRHPVLSRCQSLVHPSRARWAGVISDLIWDHFLAKHWTEFSAVGLETYTRRFYRELKSRPEWHFGRLPTIVDSLCQERWLEHYATLHGMRRTFNGMSYRSKRSGPLKFGILDLTEHYCAWEARFLHGYPQLLDSLKSHPPGK